MSKITVIIPVYNAESSIDKCVDSILRQSFCDFSIIIVNDGSTDNTKKELRKYSTNSRIKIIETKNQGVSAARNEALKYVVSKYICFIDSDDYIEPNYLQDLFNGISCKEKIDMAVINISKQKSDGEKIYKSHYISGIMDAKTFSAYILAFNGPGGYLWNKIFKKDIIYNNSLQFDTELCISEDLLFCSRYLKSCSTVNILDSQGYNYIVTDSGITGSGKKRSKKAHYLSNYRIALKKIIKCLDMTNNQTAKSNCEARIVQVDGSILRLTKNREVKEEIRLEIRQYIKSFRKSKIISFKQKLIVIMSVCISYLF